MTKTLREQVAQRLKVEVWTVKVAGLTDAEAQHLADAAIGVVLGVVAEQIKALPRSTPVVGWPGVSMHKSDGGSWIHVDDVRAVVERLRG